MIKFLKQLFCFHVFEYDLTEVTSEHHIVIDCRKCGKKKEEFK